MDIFLVGLKLLESIRVSLLKEGVEIFLRA